ITTPADGDSVLAVGAVDVFGTVGAFSSYGPSADGRIKPDVVSVGVNALVQAPSNQFGYINGTSLACPAMAGLASCLWQGFPEVNNMRIIRALREAGSTYQNPNNRIGYGIPDMKKAFITLLKEQATSSATISNCSVQLNWTSKDSEGMKYEIERLAPGDTRYSLIGQLRAMTGNTFKTHTYQVSDPLNGIPPGIITYRIRQVLDSSRASFTDAYIDTIEVTPGTTCTSDITAVYVSPNP
ncbi:MAG TPA: S8 family serine peptidase, partial [Chitinophagaceae bacterium]|nr:S8 family serine peptidase [Chitinophagaceae bacterium]